MPSQPNSEDKRQERSEHRIIGVGDSQENLEKRHDPAYDPPRGKTPSPPPPEDTSPPPASEEGNTDE